jgi:glycosyltransferase involved in cell wall biosynthesis
VFGDKYDVIWTHTEYEHLGIAALRWLTRKQGAPVIAQSVWLVDAWPKFWPRKQWLYRVLLKKSAVATFHSSKNEAIARSTFAGTRTEVVQFGISLDSFPLQVPRMRFEDNRPVRVLALGTDRHRDWATLFEALGGRPEFELRVGSGSWPKSLIAANTHVAVMTQAEVRAAYEWADCVTVPLKHNLHASGITAILEAVASGVPVIATLTGGLEDYVDGSGVSYVAQGDAGALRQAVLALSVDAPVALTRAVCAQQQMVERSLTSRGFAHRHVVLSKRLLQPAMPKNSNP